MSSEELITKQAEAVLAVDAGIPGQNPRVWAYRNTIKALNWYTAVREKLDDPKCKRFSTYRCSYQLVCFKRVLRSPLGLVVDVLPSLKTIQQSPFFFERTGT